MVDEISTGSTHDKAGATAAFAGKVKIITGALATIQIAVVVNRTMLRSLGELPVLAPVKKGGPGRWFKIQGLLFPVAVV